MSGAKKKTKALILLTILLGCDFPVTEYSSNLQEDAFVEETIYTPSQHGSAVGPTFSQSGKIGVAITSVNINEKYGVVFCCQHGKFVIQGEGDKYKNLWSKLKRGDSVIVTYREVYEVYKTANICSLKKYDFLDANKKNRAAGIKEGVPVHHATAAAQNTEEH